jgi:hypothetical protein
LCASARTSRTFDTSTFRTFSRLDSRLLISFQQNLFNGVRSACFINYDINYDEKEKLSGIVATVACPAQCVQHRLFMSPDYWGEVKMLLRRHFGEHIFLLGLCSIAGDQCPVDLIRWVEPESDLNDPNISRNNPPKRKADPSMFDLTGIRKAGKRIANEIISVYEEDLDDVQEDVVFEHQVHMMQLPVRRATLSDVAAARKAIREYFRDMDRDVDYNDAAKLQVYLGILRRAEQQEKIEVIDAEVHINLHFAAEAASQIGIKKGLILIFWYNLLLKEDTLQSTVR